jgi:hypothetical protein
MSERVRFSFRPDGDCGFRTVGSVSLDYGFGLLVGVEYWHLGTSNRVARLATRALSRYNAGHASSTGGT